MSSRPDRRRDEAGQAVVEMALVLPLVALLLAIAFNAWSAMQLSVRLTSAARAGALVAASDLGKNDTAKQAQDAATAAINAEESTNVYQDINAVAANYVSMSQPPPQSVSGVNIDVVTVTITESSTTLIPFVHDLSVNAHATARYA